MTRCMDDDFGRGAKQTLEKYKKINLMVIIFSMKFRKKGE